jgi:TrmH family RNA methyltransferase
VVRLRRLVARASVHRSEGVFVVEGPKVLESALDAGAEVEGVYYDLARYEQVHGVLERAMASGVRTFGLMPGAMERISDTVTPQPVCATVRHPRYELADLLGEPDGPGTTRDARAGRVVCVCAEVRDPGNLGAIVRSAAASGGAAVLCSRGSADAFAPKTVRASAGAVLFVPLLEQVDLLETLPRLRAARYRLLAAVSRGGEDYRGRILEGPVALLLGNEAAGLAPELRALADGEVSIPTFGATESLNVAMAATLLCFEVARREHPVAPAPRAGPSLETAMVP